MRIFSDSFFHYTEDFKVLPKIIEQGFKVSISKEQYISSSGQLHYIQIPLVCFCDIPLSLIDYVTYGHIGIGMSRSWGKAKKLQPVQYFSNSKLAISRVVEQHLIDCYSSNVLVESSIIRRQLSLLKPCEKYRDDSYGYRMITTKKGNEEKQFYRRDNYIEREWRKIYMNHWNDEYYMRNPSYLKFYSKDVKFLIVETENQRESLLNSILSLKNIGGYPCSENQKQSLCSKILVLNEIKKNF